MMVPGKEHFLTGSLVSKAEVCHPCPHLKSKCNQDLTAFLLEETGGKHVKAGPAYNATLLGTWRVTLHPQPLSRGSQSTSKGDPFVLESNQLDPTGAWEASSSRQAPVPQLCSASSWSSGTRCHPSLCSQQLRLWHTLNTWRKLVVTAENLEHIWPWDTVPGTYMSVPCTIEWYSTLSFI